MSLLLVDDLKSLPFVILFVFDITQQEYKVLALAWVKGYLDIVRSDRTPSVSMTVTWLTLHHSLRIGKLVIQAYECLAVSIEALNICIYMIECIVITTLTILCLMIDCVALNLNLSSREITLEILHIGSSIP